MKLPKFIKEALRKWCIKNFPLQETTKVHFKTLVKKGKIREWRTYDENHVRIN